MSDHNIGSGPVQDEYRAIMREIAETIDHVFNGDAPKSERQTGWVLMVFPFGPGQGRCNYMSNARREDVITMLKEQLSYFEGKPDKNQEPDHG